MIIFSNDTSFDVILLSSTLSFQITAQSLDNLNITPEQKQIAMQHLNSSKKKPLKATKRA